MKKQMALIVSLLLVIFCVLSVNAKSMPPNYLQGLSWQNGYSLKVENSDGLYVEATNITKSFSSPVLNIAPALKQIFYDHNMSGYIKVKIGGKIKIDYADKKTSDKLHLIIRAHTNLNDPEAWKEDYIKSLKGTEPFFNVTGNNVLKSISSDFNVTTAWTEFSTYVTFSKNNVFSKHVSNWNLCLDGFDPNLNPQKLYLKDMFLEVTTVSNSNPDKTPVVKTPAPTQKLTPTAAIPPRVTPARTLAPFNTPVGELVANPTATLKPTNEPYKDEEIREEFKNQPLFKDVKNIISLSIKGVIVIVIIAGFFAIVTNLFKRRK